jgi:hypothetical protein
MSVFIASLILIIIASAYAVFLKRKLAETIFLSVTTIVVVLYCFGLINIQGCLLYGIYTIVLFAFLCLTFLIYKQIKIKNILKDTEIIQGLLLYLILLSFSLFINFGMVFHHWDEFSHWGIVVKYFYNVDAFATLQNSDFNKIMFPQYFPGVSLFQYFFSRFDSDFIEYYSYVAKNILYFSLFLPLISNLFNKAKWIKSIFFLIIFILIPLQRESFYSSLYVDEILGAFFGFILVYYFIYKYEKSKYGILMVTASAFMTTITKDIGLLLSLGCIAIIILDILLFRRTQLKSFILQKSFFACKTGKIILISLPLLMVIFLKISWALLLLKSGMKAGGFWRQPSLHDIINLITKQIQPYQKETALNLISAVFHMKLVPFNLSIFWFCGVFLLIVLILTLYYKRQISLKRTVSSALVFAVGAGIYQIVLMILYVFSFSQYEAVRLASYDRYTFTYMLGMIYFIIIFFFIDNKNYKQIDIKCIINKLITSYKKIIIKFSSNSIVMYKDITVGIKIIFFTLCSIMIIKICFIVNKDLSSLIIIKAERYIYILGMIYFIIILFIINNDKHTNISIKRNIMIGKFGMKLLYFTLCSIMIYKLCIFSNIGVVRIRENRLYLHHFFRSTEIINKWKPYLKGKLLNIIIQGDNGWYKHQLSFELSPIYKHSTAWADYSIRPERPPESTIEEDMYNLTLTPDEWQEYVMKNKFDLIYMLRSNETFINAYSQFFPYGVVEDMLYNVTYENGVMQLIPVK